MILFSVVIVINTHTTKCFQMFILRTSIIYTNHIKIIVYLEI